MTEGDKVWVLTCRCGWSRMVPRSTPTARRRQILENHRTEGHGDTLSPDDQRED